MSFWFVATARAATGQPRTPITPAKIEGRVEEIVTSMDELFRNNGLVGDPGGTLIETDTDPLPAVNPFAPAKLCAAAIAALEFPGMYRAPASAAASAAFC